MTTDSRSGYLDIFMPLLFVGVIFFAGMVAGVGLSVVIVWWWVR